MAGICLFPSCVLFLSVLSRFFLSFCLSFSLFNLFDENCVGHKKQEIGRKKKSYDICTADINEREKK